MKLLLKFICLFTIFHFSSSSSLIAQTEQLLSLNKLIVNLKGNHNETSIKKFESINEACESEFITCDAKLRIVALNFQYSNLNGFISNDILNLQSLKYINLEYNYLYGPIPKGIEKLKQLNNLLLTGNFLSGNVPEDFQALSNKVAININFSQNAFDIQDERLLSKLKIRDQIDISGNTSIDNFLLKNSQDIELLNAQKLRGIDEQPKLVSSNSNATKSNLSTYMRQLTYPKIAREKGINGTVRIRFYVSKKGKIKGSQIIEDIGERCGNAALWQINRLNFKHNWIPGKYNGKTVDVPMGLPVKFYTLSEDTNKTRTQPNTELEGSVLSNTNVGGDKTQETLDSLNYVEQYKSYKMSKGLLHKALDRIKRVMETKSDTLSLSNLALKELPDELFELVHLRKLDLSINQLDSLPDGIMKLVNLQELNLRKNYLEKVPVPITNLVNLRTLNLSFNAVDSVPASFEKLINLQELRLDDNDFISLPEEITKLVNLKKLNLNFNLLSSLPSSVANLVNLQELSLRRNRFIVWPNSLDKLVNLQDLNLMRNQLTNVPDGIMNLVNLKKLNLSQNKLVSMPEGIATLTNLQELDLRWNQLTSMPSGVMNLVNLRRLNLSLNQLTSLPESITKLDKLKELNLSKNKLTSIPKSITNLVNLRELNLNTNRLVSIPEPITNMVNLEVLNLATTRLTSIPESISNLVNLKELYLDNNKFRSFPLATTKLVSLRVLDLGSNRLNSLPEQIGNLVNLKELDLNNNQLNSLPIGFSNLLKLQVLDLGFNNLSSLPASITALDNLKELNLIHNQISSLSDDIGNLVHLEKLNLNYNNLSSIPTNIRYLVNLNNLTLVQNQLSSLPEGFENLVNLQELDLSENQLNNFPESLSNLVNLQELNLSRNQLKMVSDNIGNLLHLERLDFGLNQLKSIPQGITKLVNLQQLHLYNNQLTSFPESLPNMLNLREFTLSDNHLTSLPYGLLTLVYLYRIDLRENQIKSIPEAVLNQPISGLTAYFEYNQLISIATDFYIKENYEKALTIYKEAWGTVSDDKVARQGMADCENELEKLESKRQIKLAAARERQFHEEWLLVKKINTIEAYEVFQNKHPNGKYYDVATTQIRKLKVPSDTGLNSGTFKDTRDGKTYRWVRLNDGKKWMAENLNYKTDESWWYDNKITNGDKYGRLYNWEAAKKACPDGWYLPTDEEWIKMATAHGGYYDWSTLKYLGVEGESYSSLIQGGNSNFSALLGGLRSSGSSDYFNNLADYGAYWSSTERNASSAWDYSFKGNYKSFGRYGHKKKEARSCRCIQD